MIQIDMPMPTNCIDCPACNEYLTCAIPITGRKWGENDVRDFSQSRPEWCPMKEKEAKTVEIYGQMFTIKYGHCPNCGEGLNSETYPHWCGFCGQKVKWNG